MKESAYGKTRLEWGEVFKDIGCSPSTLPLWTDGLYRQRNTWRPGLSPKALAYLESHYSRELPTLFELKKSDDGTVKFLLQMQDGQKVETVLIPFFKRSSICVSTQVGCAMNCQFCFTGTQGLKRNLTTEEIVGQYLVVKDWAEQENPLSLPPSLVFMGQGEPLHNAQNVRRATSIFRDPTLIGLGPRQITLSTAGYLPGIGLLKEFDGINIALSLHSPFDHERSELIPMNKKYPLRSVLEALDEHPLLNNQFITFEYLMIQDFNISQTHADALYELLHHRRAILNLIPFNPYPGSKWKRPLANEISSFKEKLVSKKLRVMVRRTKGEDILAACGQLNTFTQEGTI